MAKVWLITGSSRGLGRAIAQAALAAGDQVVATARNLDDVADLVEEHGDRVCPVRLDVRHAEESRQAVATGVEAFGRLDVVVNNAGHGFVASVEECSDEDWREQLDTNLWGAIAVTRAALPVLRAQRSGHIVTMGSIVGRTSFSSSGYAPYITAKHGLAGFSDALGNEVRPFGVKVTLIEPGGFRTNWTGDSLRFGEIGEDYAQTVGEFADRFRNADRQLMIGDPAKLASVLLEVVAMDEPPTRLLLGSDAREMARVTSEELTAADAKWDYLTRTTDADVV